MTKTWIALLLIFLLSGCGQAVLEVSPLPQGPDEKLSLTDTLNPPTKIPATSTPAEIHTPAPTPQGQIAFSQGFGSQVDSLNVFDLADGSVRQVLSDLEAPIWEISWTPDGDALAFSAGVTTFSFNLISVDGTGLISLSDGDASNFYAPFWSPDGLEVTVVKTNFFDEYELLTLKRDGSGKASGYDIPITGLTMFMDFNWSPDGTMLAFSGYQIEQDLYGLYLVNKDGSQLTQIISDTMQIETPHWSPDGSKVVYEVQGDIFLVNTDGGERVQLTQGLGRDFSPVWSPDGTWIAYYSQKEGGRPRLHVMDGDGRNQRVVLGKDAVGDGLNDLHWSTDSKYITVRFGQKVVVVDVIQAAIVGEIEQAFALAWMP